VRDKLGFLDMTLGRGRHHQSPVADQLGRRRGRVLHPPPANLKQKLERARLQLQF
jgi:hypothetical protein